MVKIQNLTNKFRDSNTRLLTCGAETHVSQRCSKKHLSPLGFMKAMLDCNKTDG